MRAFLFALAAGLIVAASPVVSAQDMSAEPTYGSESLDEGFLPDPYSMELTAGGSIEVDKPGCSYGNVASAPDMDLYYSTSGESTLYIYAISGDDTTILVNTADGNWVCDDDSYGDGDPIVVIPAASTGLYNIWVGTYGDDMASATLYISEIDPRDSDDDEGGSYSSGSTPDITAEPTYGSESLDEGFLPDPYSLNLTAGGSIELDMGDCSYGYVASAPDMDLYYSTSGDSNLYIYATSGEDTTILINTADGDWICNDDGYGDGDPIVVLPNASTGLYNIWVGTYSDDAASATLYISEIDPR